MNDKNKKGLVVLGVLLGIGGIYYYLTSTKKAYAKVIGKMTERDWRVYKDMDKGYLKARAKSVKRANPTFEYNDKVYVTETGKAKQD